MPSNSSVTNSTQTRRDIIIAIGGAAGGAIMSTLSNLVLEDRRASNEARENAARRAAEKTEQAATQRQKTLELLAGAFFDLGDQNRLAVEFSENGKIGSPDDVRLVFRHFSRVVNTISIGAVSSNEVIKYYGRGRIEGWGKRFINLSNGVAPMSKRFSTNERYNFGVTGSYLIRLVK